MSLAELIAETHQRVADALETVRSARLAVEARTLAIEGLVGEPCEVCGLLPVDHPDTPDCFNGRPDPDLQDPELDDDWEARRR